MNQLVIVFLALLFTAFMGKSKGDNLNNGSYTVRYDRQYRQHYKSFKLEINGNTVIEKYGDDIKVSKIKWIDKNAFRLIRDAEKEDSLSDLQKKLLTLGEPYYEITDCEKNRISFTLRRNPHIIISSGIFIREK